MMRKLCGGQVEFIEGTWICNCNSTVTNQTPKEKLKHAGPGARGLQVIRPTGVACSALLSVRIL